MIRHRPPSEVLEDLRYALGVMEEQSHLGLDRKHAEIVRGALLRQIASVEAEIARESLALAQPPTSLELPE